MQLHQGITGRREARQHPGQVGDSTRAQRGRASAGVPQLPTEEEEHLELIHTSSFLMQVCIHVTQNHLQNTSHHWILLKNPDDM